VLGPGEERGHERWGISLATLGGPWRSCAQTEGCFRGVTTGPLTLRIGHGLLNNNVSRRRIRAWAGEGL